MIFIIIYLYKIKNKKSEVDENMTENVIKKEIIQEELFDEPLEQEFEENPDLEKEKMDVEAAKYKLIEEREKLFFNKNLFHLLIM